MDEDIACGANGLQVIDVANHRHVAEMRRENVVSSLGASNNRNFPEMLFDVLSSQEHAQSIAWLPHGRGFVIHDKQRFADAVLPRHFDGAKFTSFTRRLTRWNFERVTTGPEVGAYYGENFVRGRLDLVRKMGEGKRRGRDVDAESKENENFKEQTDKEAGSRVHGKFPDKDTVKSSWFNPIKQQEDRKPRPRETRSAIEMRTARPVARYWPSGTMDRTNSQGPLDMLRKSPQAANIAATSSSLTATGPLGNHTATTIAGHGNASVAWPDPPRSNSHPGYGGSAHLGGEGRNPLFMGCDPFTQSSHYETRRNVRAAHYGGGTRAAVTSKEAEEEEEDVSDEYSLLK